MYRSLGEALKAGALAACMLGSRYRPNANTARERDEKVIKSFIVGFVAWREYPRTVSWSQRHTDIKASRTDAS
jgi:hypothetical protein